MCIRDSLKGDAPDAEAHRKFYDEYNAVLDMDSAYYLETIKTVFQEFALPQGTWKVGGQLVRPQDIKKTALLAIEGELDDISGSGQTSAALELCAGIPKSNKEEYEVKGAGHYGIFSGRRWREMVYPKISEFIRKHPGTSITPVVTKTSTPTTKTVSKSALPAKKVAAKKTVTPKTTAKPVVAKVIRTKTTSTSRSKA